MQHRAAATAEGAGGKVAGTTDAEACCYRRTRKRPKRRRQQQRWSGMQAGAVLTTDAGTNGAAEAGAGEEIFVKARAWDVALK